MGYLKGLVNASKKKKDDGTVIYYPHGIFGKGYQISEETEQEIDNFLRKFYISLFIIIGIGSGIFRYGGLVGLLMIPVYYYKISQLLTDGREVEEGLNLKEQHENIARNMGFPTVLILFIMFIPLFIGSIWVFLITSMILTKIFSGLAIILFFLGIIQFGYMLYKYC